MRLSAALAIAMWASFVSAGEYKEADVVDWDKHKILQISVGDQQKSIDVHMAHFTNEKGKSLSHKSGIAMLATATKVTVSSDPDPKNPDVEIARTIHLVKFQSSDNVTVAPKRTKPEKSQPMRGAKLPTGPLEKLDLHPDPSYKGPIPDVAVGSPYMKWFPTAKVGDFTEYAQNRGWVRYEVVAIDGPAVIIATVAQIETVKTENRARMSLGADQKKDAGTRKLAPGTKKLPPEKVTVNGKDLQCEVVTNQGFKTYYSNEVPLTQIAKEEMRYDKMDLIEFGRGK